jgi:hypothetical protein
MRHLPKDSIIKIEMMRKEQEKKRKREAFKQAKPKSFYSKKMQEMAEQTDMHLRAAALPD